MKLISKKRKNFGFTTAEMMVSGGVMLAITFLTFDVMLTNAKISTAGVKAASEESTQRSGIELLQQDILTSEVALTNARDAGSYDAKNNKMLILRQPVYDTAGKAVSGKKNVVVYTVYDKGGVKTLCRLAGIQTGKSAFTLSRTDIIASDVKSFKFRLAKSVSVTPVLTGLPLPGIPTTSDPAYGTIRLLKIKAMTPAIDIEKDGEDESKRGISTIDQLEIKTKVLNAYLSPTSPKPLPAVDVLYEVDEESTSNSDGSIDANQIKIWITVKGRDDQPNTILSATGMMRNAQ
jgi:hypothetical protein